MTNNNEKNGKGFVQRSSRKSRFLVKTNLAIIALLAVLMVLSVVPPGIGLDSSEGVSASSVRFTASPATVDLGSAYDFTILSKAGVTTTGTTYVVGDIGTSPIDSTAITGFGLSMDPSNQFSTSVLVDGRIYAADYTVPTPSMLTTAISDMEIAYTDAAGRPNPDVTELGSGEIGGLTIAPGLYKWGTGVLISQDVILEGDASAVWIFQIAQTLDIADGKKVILSGGANAQNIFWQVGGQATMGTTSTMHGTILCEVAIVMKTGSTLNGRALAQTEVTMDANAVTSIVDDTPPTVISTVPESDELNVPYNSALTATFSEAMSVPTLTNVTFTLRQGTTIIDGDVSYSGMTATFTPKLDLAASTEYNATISTGATDIAGNALAEDYSWNFTTAATADTTAPTVIAVIPLDDATDVATNTTLNATFSEVMKAGTINNVTFTLMNGTNVIIGAVTYSGVNASFTPIGGLLGETRYTATITTGAQDMAGNALAEDFTWNFTTGILLDTTAPRVLSVIPVNGTEGIAYDSTLKATFSEVMNESTVTNLTFVLMQGTNVIDGTVTYVDRNATFTPTVNLTGETVYTATVNTGAEDLAGNALAGNYTWSFTTADTTAPTVVSVIPVNGAIDIAYNSTLTALFSEAMNASTITNVTFTLKQGATVINGTVAYVDLNATFTPTVNLSADTEYTATISTEVEDLAGNGLVSNYTWSFNTAALPDTTPPTVLSVIPVNGATEVAYNSALMATFSENMNESTITNVTFTLKQGTTVIAGTVAYIDMTATFTPLVNLSAETEYTATISTAVEDLSGNALVNNYTWSFTTGALADTTAPTVVSVIPVDEATGVALNSSITIVFSEAMDPLTMTNVTITVTQGDTVIEGTVTYSGMTAIFNPTSDLLAGTVYTVTVSTGAEDLAGNGLASDYTWSFTTVSEDSGGVSYWGIALIILVIIAAIIGVIFLRR